MKKLLGGMLEASGWLILLYDCFEGSFGITDSFINVTIWIVYLLISSAVGKILASEGDSENTEN